MASDREIFHLSGPLHLSPVDWESSRHRTSVAASLVQGVYILELDRQQNRQGSKALAPPWWQFFHFRLLRPLIDNVDSSIFAAIYEFKPTCSVYNDTIYRCPRYVIAFRGTLTKQGSFCRDLELDLHLIQSRLNGTSRFEISMKAVQNMVDTVGDSNIWLVGHSLGSGMAMLTGKTMAKMGIFLKSFLFNPPFISIPVERIKDVRLKHGLRFAGSVITAGMALTMKGRNYKNKPEDPFVVLSEWIPNLFVNADDHFCSEYIGYFEHRKKMEEIGAGGIERLATQNSVGGLLLNAFGRECEPLHLIPSANIVVNLSASRSFKHAHGLHQWWQPDIRFQSKVYRYSDSLWH